MQATNNAAAKPSSSVTVLDKFRPFDRLIELLLSMFYAICATSIVVFTPMLAYLVVRCALRDDPSIDKLAVATPLSLSLTQTWSTFVAMVWQNRDISAAIEHLQRAVNHRKCHIRFVMPKTCAHPNLSA